MSRKTQFKVGDYARNVESGWLGRIEEILPPQEVTVTDTESFTETMARMIGVDTLACTVGGFTWEQALCSDDTQWHSLDDLIHEVEHPN